MFKQTHSARASCIITPAFSPLFFFLTPPPPSTLLFSASLLSFPKTLIAGLTLRRHSSLSACMHACVRVRALRFCVSAGTVLSNCGYLIPCNLHMCVWVNTCMSVLHTRGEGHPCKCITCTSAPNHRQLNSE